MPICPPEGPPEGLPEGRPEGTPGDFNQGLEEWRVWRMRKPDAGTSKTSSRIWSRGNPHDDKGVGGMSRKQVNYYYYYD